MQPTAYPIQPHSLEQCWRAFMENGQVYAGAEFAPDPVVIQSWKRCAPRLDPWTKPQFNRAKEQAFESTLKGHAELLTVAIPHIEDIHQFIEGSNCAILLADGSACVLSMGGDKNAMLALNELGLGYGVYWAEGQVGTNALSLVLDTAMPVQVVGAEHYLRALHPWVSTAAPIHDVHGRISGVLAIIGAADQATSHTLSLVMAAARAVSNQLQANLYLEEANRRLGEVNAVLAAMNEGVLAWDETGKINHVNPQAEKMLRLTATAALGRTLSEVLQVPAILTQAMAEQKELRDVEVSFEGEGYTLRSIVSLQPMFEGAIPVGCIATFRPIEQVRQLVQQQVGAQATLTLEDIPAESTAMRRVLRQATFAARGRAPVLLRGEAGVGKNALGRAIHNAGERANKPFIIINCGAIPHELMIAEFLGQEQDAANQGRPSKFELVEGGTLLLNQIDALSLEMQSALLQVIETEHVMRLYGTRLIPIDVRIIAATTANLERLVAEGSFVRQLYYAFGVFNFYIPPLRERVEDIAHYAERFLSRITHSQARDFWIDDETMAILRRYPWPGNVRELENVLERALNHSLDGVIRLIDLPDLVRSGRVLDRSDSPSPAPEPIVTTAAAEREAIIRAGWACRGRVSEMAQQLGIGRTTLWRRLKHFNVSPHQFKR